MGFARPMRAATSGFAMNNKQIAAWANILNEWYWMHST